MLISMHRIDEKKVVLYNKCDGVVDVVKKNSSRYERVCFYLSLPTHPSSSPSLYIYIYIYIYSSHPPIITQFTYLHIIAY